MIEVMNKEQQRRYDRLMALCSKVDASKVVPFDEYLKQGITKIQMKYAKPKLN